MEHLFLTVLNMSITASYVILFVLLARLFLKKAPKIFSYCLWSVVLFRLVCPFSFSSTLSLFGILNTGTMEHIPQNIGYMTKPQVNMGIDSVNNYVNNSLPAATPVVSVNPMQVLVFISSVLWIAGVVSLLIYSVLSYARLKRKVSTAMLVSDNIFESEKISSPFVLGIIKPKIYMPMGIAENECAYILMHEQTHIKRFDYLIKPFAFLVLCFHWFNPLVWVSFVLMSHDMEMSCDERVLKEMDRNIKKDYSNSLLALAIHKTIINGSPLAFGESNVKGRIKNVLNYKKPTFLIVAASIILISVVGVGFAANPKSGGGFKISDDALHREQMIIRMNDSGGAIISGSEFLKFLETASDNWSKIHIPMAPENTLDLTVYINIGSDYNIHFYKSDPELAMVQLDGKQHYYKIPKGTYEKVFAMYAVRNPIVPEKVMRAIADGKRTNLKSVQDLPNNGACQVLKVGNENYFIYKKGSRYYVEQPYIFINEITEEVYKDAVGYAAAVTGIENKPIKIPVAADLKPASHAALNSFEGVAMVVKSETVSSKGLTLVFENNSMKNCIFGSNFVLEKKINGTWYQVPVIIEGNYGFTTIGYYLYPGQNTEWKADWNWLYGSLDSGEYRIIKDILDFRKAGDYDTYILAAEFIINNPI